MEFFVTRDDLILVSTPGKGEVGDSIVQVGCVEVEDSRKALALVEKVPGGEVAMQDSRIRTVQIQAVKGLSRLVDVPPRNVSFVWPEFLVFLNRVNEPRVADKFISKTESPALPHPGKATRGFV